MPTTTKPQFERISRNQSVVTGKPNLEFLHAYPSFPVFIGATKQHPDEDIFADMHWYICKDSGVIQLQSLLPPDIVYSAYHSEAIGGIWRRHHDLFVDFCGRHQIGNVLEIGGSNGYIATQFLQKWGNTPWTIVEPNPEIASDPNITVVKEFWGQHSPVGAVGAIVHSHVLEHSYDPNEFLSFVFKSLEEGQYQLFSVPNLYAYLSNFYTNAINFEHTYFLAEELLDYLLVENGFEIMTKEYFEQHSIFYSTRKNSNLGRAKLPNLHDNYKKLYRAFVDYYEMEVTKLNRLIDEFSGDVYLFGAHIFSQFLVYLGLNDERIVRVLDNSPRKRNLRLYGTKLYIDTPERLHEQNESAVILKVGQYQNEVRSQLMTLNPGLTIWE